MPHKEPPIVKQLEAVSLSIQPEGTVFLNSKMLPEVADWSVGEHYIIAQIDMVQTGSKLLEDGTVEAEFDIKIVQVKDG